MEACIEALFNIEGENGKRKTIEMIRVLKGAISVSKSRTGEVIYHYNRHEKKALRRQLAKYDKDTRRSRQEIEHQKRDILRKWSLVFGRQRNFCDSIRGFDDMLAEAIILRDKLKEEEDEEEGEDEEEEAGRVQGELERLEEEKKKKTPVIEDPRKRRLFVHLNPVQETAPSTSPAPTTTGMLPKINFNAGVLFNGRIESEAEEQERLEREAEEERQRKAKELPRFDKALVRDFLQQQKSMHEELLTRNTLMKIKSQANNDHVFFKYRMKTRLPGSAHSLLRHIEHERPGDGDREGATTAISATGTAGPLTDRDSTLLTRQSSRSELTLGSRQTSRADLASQQSDMTRTSRSYSRHFRHQQPDLNQRKRSEPSTRSRSSFLPVTSRLTVTADGSNPPPRLGDRAKTVHFS